MDVVPDGGYSCFPWLSGRGASVPGRSAPEEERRYELYEHRAAPGLFHRATPLRPPLEQTLYNGVRDQSW